MFGITRWMYCYTLLGHIRVFIPMIDRYKGGTVYMSILSYERDSAHGCHPSRTGEQMIIFHDIFSEDTYMQTVCMQTNTYYP